MEILETFRKKLRINYKMGAILFSYIKGKHFYESDFSKTFNSTIN